MAIEDAEKRAPGPALEIFLAFRLHYVQNDRNSIFVVIADKALVRVGCVRSDHSVAFHGGFRRLVWDVLGKDDLAGWLQWFVGVLTERASKSLLAGAGYTSGKGHLYFTASDSALGSDMAERCCPKLSSDSIMNVPRRLDLPLCNLGLMVSTLIA